MYNLYRLIKSNCNLFMVSWFAANTDKFILLCMFLNVFCLCVGWIPSIFLAQFFSIHQSIHPSTHPFILIDVRLLFKLGLLSPHPRCHSAGWMLPFTNTCVRTDTYSHTAYVSLSWDRYTHNEDAMTICSPHTYIPTQSHIRPTYLLPYRPIK